MTYKHISLTQSQQKIKQNSLNGARHWTVAIMFIVLGFFLLETQHAMADELTEQKSAATKQGKHYETNSHESIVLVRLITPATTNAATPHLMNFPKTALGPDVLWLVSFVSFILAGGSYAISRMIVPATKDGILRSV